jgi:two-component system, OmpR family, response regulator MtrA
VGWRLPHVGKQIANEWDERVTARLQGVVAWVVTAMILLVEDDPETARSLTDVLESSGYRVTIARTGSEARSTIEQMRPDLIMLDLMLPDTDGLVLTAAFKTLTNAPIIICSARHGQVDRVLGLKLGADDLVISQSRGTVLLAGHPVHLTPTEYRLLVALASRPNEVLSREALGQLVWGYEDIGTGHLIDVHIGRLRLKLRRASSSGPVIVTVRGKGYKIGTGSSNPAGEGESDDDPRSSSGSPSR